MRWSPASYSASIVQSIQASTPASTGAPEGAGVQPTPMKRSTPWVANVRDSASWSSARMLTQNVPTTCSIGHVDDDRDTQNATRGGSSDTDVNELTAKPSGRPPD